MIFNKDTLEVGGLIVIPASFLNNKTPGEIISKTTVGIAVIYNKGKFNQQRAFYAYEWLNQEYGSDTDGKLDDKIPF